MDGCTFIDAKGTVNYFDDSRVHLLAKSVVSVVDFMWPKAKPDAIVALTEYTIWRFLELSKNYAVLTPGDRASVCEVMANELNHKYTNRCRERVLKKGRTTSKRQLDAHKDMFLQYSSVLAFVVFGDLKKSFTLIEA